MKKLVIAFMVLAMMALTVPAMAGTPPIKKGIITEQVYGVICDNAFFGPVHVEYTTNVEQVRLWNKDGTEAGRCPVSKAIMMPFPNMAD